MTPPADLVAWWPLDAIDRISAVDIAGPHHARLAGAASIAGGQVGNAMNFPGTGGRLQVPDHDDLDTGRGDFSFDFWLRTNDTSPLVTILDKRTLTPVRGYSIWLASGRLGVQLADGHGPSASCSNDPGAACTNYGTSAFVVDGQWHFVAVSVDRDDPGGGRVFVDGRLAATFDPTARRGSLANAANLLIGASNDTIGGTYRGLLDEVELFSRALSEAEVRALFSAGRAGKCKPRVVSVAGSPVRVALTGTSSYRVALDGQTFSRPLPQQPRVQLRYRPFDPLAERPPAVPTVLRQDDAEVVIAQFVTQPLEAYRAAIETLGGETYTFLPDQALLVRIPARSRRALESQPFVRWVGPYHPAYKLEEVLRERLVSGVKTGPARYNVEVLERGEMVGTVAERIAQFGGKVENAQPLGFFIEATLDDTQLLAVSRLWQVLFIDRWNPPEPDMDIVRQIGGASHVELVGGYAGQGVRGEVLDEGLRFSHKDFAAHPPLEHGSTAGSGYHGTKVYGVVFGTGATDGRARGLLPEGQGIFSSYSHGGLKDRYIHTAELVNPNLPYRASFQTNSWGNGLTTTYDTESSKLDDVVFMNDLLITQAQSNDGTNKSRPEAWAKNVVSVGGIYHFDTFATSDDKWFNPSDSSRKPASFGPPTMAG